MYQEVIHKPALYIHDDSIINLDHLDISTENDPTQVYGNLFRHSVNRFIIKLKLRGSLSRPI